jgi:hypothetical protein
MSVLFFQVLDIIRKYMFLNLMDLVTEFKKGKAMFNRGRTF